MNILVSDMDWIGFPDASIASATLTNVGGGDGFGLAFGADSVSFQVADTSQNRGEQVRIAFTVDPGEVEVSEPSTAFLLGLSFIALGLFVQCRPMWDA
jgi:hypothetical protein